MKYDIKNANVEIENDDNKVFVSVGGLMLEVRVDPDQGYFYVQIHSEDNIVHDVLVKQPE